LATAPVHLRVFLSSPGDVPEERAAALELLNEFDRKTWVRDRNVTIEVVAWDDPVAGTPMDATLTPQLSVVQHNLPPSECDLTIVILWGRLGTRLPPNVRKPDGAHYLSGTEWELDDARRAKKPLWIYRRKRFAPDMDAPDYAEKVGQYQSLKQFLGGLRAADGSILGGVNEYEHVSDFRDLLERHLEAEISRRLNQGESTRQKSDRFNVFLAHAADELVVFRERLQRELNALPTVRVLDKVPPPWEPPGAHAHAARRAAEEADLCVHLLGSSPGPVIPGAHPDTHPDETYPMAQLRAGLEQARSQLILHPDGFRLESTPSGPYRELVAETHQRQDDRLRLEIVSTTELKFLERVLEKQRALEEHARTTVSASTRRTAFVDAHELDSADARPLFDFLDRHVVMLPDARGLRRGSQQEDFETFVSRAQYLIVVYGNVASDWVLGRLEAAMKVVAERGQRLRIGVYVRPGAPHLPSRVPDYSTLLDNSAGFDPKPVEGFLGLSTAS
jgi:hypothetical protein